MVTGAGVGPCLGAGGQVTCRPACSSRALRRRRDLTGLAHHTVLPDRDLRELAMHIESKAPALTAHPQRSWNMEGDGRANDTYGFALAAHPGKSQGRPPTNTGSKPIEQDRPARPRLLPDAPVPDGRTVLTNPDVKDLEAVEGHRRHLAVSYGIPTLLERSLAEVKRRTKVIGPFPGEMSCLTLVWAVLTSTSPTPRTASDSASSNANASSGSDTKAANKRLPRRSAPLRLKPQGT